MRDESQLNKHKQTKGVNLQVSQSEHEKVSLHVLILKKKVSEHVILKYKKVSLHVFI